MDEERLDVIRKRMIVIGISLPNNKHSKELYGFVKELLDELAKFEYKTAIGKKWKKRKPFGEYE